MQIRFWLNVICSLGFLTYSSALVSAAGRTSNGAPIVLNFPDHYSIGEVLLIKPSAAPDQSEPVITTQFPARGRFKFPPGTRVILKLNYQGSQRMADLDRLPASAIFGLNLKRLEVSDDDFAHVGRLTGLEHLQLESTDISSKGVVHLESLKNLRFLGIDKTLIRGDSMKSIGKLTAIENLIIGHNQLDDDCYKYLVGLKNLKNLHVDNVHMSDKAVDYFIKLPSLKLIKMSGNNRISDRAMARFQNTNISAITAQDTGVGPGSVPYFLKMPNLKFLKLEGRMFPPESRKILKQMLPRVNIVFEGQEKNYPSELFAPLH